MSKLVVKMVPSTTGAASAELLPSGRFRVVGSGYTQIIIDDQPIAWLVGADLRFGLDRQELILSYSDGTNAWYDITSGGAEFEIELDQSEEG